MAENKPEEKRKSNTKLIIAIIILILFIIFSVRFLSGEDNWVCKDGKWQKHGNPNSPQPIEQCK